MSDNNIIPFSDTAGRLVIFEDARREIAEATSVDQVNRVLALATGLAAAARKATDREMEAEAAALRMEAERKLGQLMKAQAETIGLNTGTAGKGRPLGGVSKTPPKTDDRPTLAQAGIDKNLAKKARAAAAMSEEEFAKDKEAKREAVLTRPKPTTEPPATSDIKKPRTRRSAKQIAAEKAEHSASFLRTTVMTAFNSENLDATVDCLLAEYIDDLVEVAQHPRFGRIVAAVKAKLGVAELEKQPAPKAVLAGTTNIAGALTLLLKNRLELKDLNGVTFDPIVMIELAGDLKNIADQLKRQQKQKQALGAAEEEEEKASS